MIKIFNLCDAKTIFNCCLVSRHFCELAVQIEHISLQITYSISNQESTVPDWLNRLLTFLSRFSKIRFAKVEFFCDAPNPNIEQMPNSLLRWKHGPLGFIILRVKKCIPSFDDDDKGDCTVIAANDLTEEDIKAFDALVKNTPCDRLLWYRYIRRIVEVLPNVQEVTAVDSRMQGHMVVDAGHIDFIKGESPSEDVPVLAKHWMAHNVKVPFSQYVLNHVDLYLIRLNDVSDDSVMQNFCREGEYCQAVMRIMAEAPSGEEGDVISKYEYF